MHLRVELSATSPVALRLAARPEAPAASLERARSLAAAVGAPTARGPVALQLVFDVTGADALGDRTSSGQGPGVGA